MGQLILDKFKRYMIALIVFVLTIQTTFADGLFKLDKAKACETGLIINELMWMGSSVSPNDQWIELKNTSDSTIDFSVNNYSIYVNDGLMLTIDSGSVPAGGYYLISNYSDVNSVLNITPDYISTDVNLINSDVQYKLYASADNTGELTDTADDGDGTPLAGDGDNKYSMERNIVSGDGSLASNWHTASSSTGFDLRATEKGTPKSDNSISTPNAPDQTKITVTENIPGNADKISGTEGAVSKNSIIKVYADSELTNLIGYESANFDGSFDQISLGDNQYSIVYVTQVVNSQQSTAVSALNDIEGPTNGSIKINDKEGVTNVRDVTLTLSATDATKMKIWGDGDFTTSTDTYIDYATSKLWTLSEDNGLKTVYVKYKDSLGNESATYEAKIYYNQNSDEPVETNLTSPADYPYTGEFTTDNYDEIKIEATINERTFMTVSKYNTNPTSSLPSGITTLNKYYDFSMPDSSKINLPVKIKIYYTTTDLINAGISDENKLTGMYYWDFNASAWKLFSNTGVDTTDTGIYAGYIWADVSDFSLISLTPISGGADLSAPAKVSNFKATSGNGEVSLSWDKNDEAVGYFVRYRKATTNDNDTYTTIYLSGKDTTSTKITGLDNNTEYEFGIAAKDSVGNISEYSVVKETPKSTSGTATQTETTLKSYWIGKAMAAESETSSNQNQNNQNQNVSTDSSNNNDEVASDDNNEESPNWTRFFITFGIILLAAGAGLGGYYGYQWWMNGEEEQEEKPIKKDKKDKQDNRW
jgi:hypothetical protein